MSGKIAPPLNRQGVTDGSPEVRRCISSQSETDSCQEKESSPLSCRAGD